MKYYILFLASLALSFSFYSGYAQSVENDDSLNKLIDELYALGGQQSHDEIAYIPIFEGCSIHEKVVEDDFDMVDGVDSLMEGLGLNSISYWFGENVLVIYFFFCLSSPILLTILGLYLKKRGNRFVGTVLMYSFLGIVLECICLCVFLGFSVIKDPDEIDGAIGGLAYFMSLGLGPFIWLFCGLYIYGFAATIYIYKRSGNRFRMFGLIVVLLFGILLPPLFVIPIGYFISKRYSRNNDCRQTFLYRLIPYFGGSLIGWSVPFLLGWFFLAI